MLLHTVCFNEARCNGNSPWGSMQCVVSVCFQKAVLTHRALLQLFLRAWWFWSTKQKKDDTTFIVSTRLR